MAWVDPPEGEELDETATLVAIDSEEFEAGDELPTDPDEADEDDITDSAEDASIPDIINDDFDAGVTAEDVEPIDEEEPDSDDELPTDPDEADESEDLDETLPANDADEPSAINDNQATLPCICSVHAGDTVMVAMRNGEPTIIGRAGWGDGIEADIASAAAVAAEAQEVASATNQHFFSDSSGVHVTEAEGDATTDHNILINSLGILLRKATNYLVSITSSAIAFYDGLGTAASNIVASFGASGAQIGKASAGNYVTIDSDSFDLYHSSTEMVHFGYGDGNAISGTSEAPYYTIGARASGSAVGNYSVAEGNNTTASGYASHAEGDGTTASGVLSHAEGYSTTAISDGSHAEGSGTAASERYSHAEGFNTTASGESSHAEGGYTTSSGAYSHAEGGYTTASRNYSHAEGFRATASGICSHAEGDGTTASGDTSHAEGFRAMARGAYSHAQNLGTITRSEAQTALGKYNVEDTNGTYAVIVGNGTSDSARSNALTVDWSGNVEAAGNVTAANIGTIVDDNISTAVSVSNNTWKSIGNVSLPAGTWVLYSSAFFPSNSTGRRCMLSHTTADTYHAGFMRLGGVSQGAVSGEITVLNSTRILSGASTTTLYLTVYQNSGSALGVTGIIRAIRIK